MATTIEQVARLAKAELDSTIALEVVGQFVAQRITEIFGKSKFKALRKLGELSLKATIGSIDGTSGGTVTVTPGTKVVTGDSTAAAAWSNEQEGWFFRIWPLHTWYRIAKVDPPNLLLESPVSTERNPDYTPGVPLSGQSYYIGQRLVPAAPDARYFGQFVLPYLYLPIDNISPEDMQRRYPSRMLVGPYPWVVSEFGLDWGKTSHPKLLEFYPLPRIDTVIGYTYWQRPPLLALGDELPPTLDVHVAREMAMIPIYRYEYMRQLKAGQVQSAELLKNEARLQESKIPDFVDEALRADNGMDDMTFIMQRYVSRRSADFDPITDARADIFSRRGGG